MARKHDSSRQPLDLDQKKDEMGAARYASLEAADGELTKAELTASGHKKMAEVADTRGALAEGAARFRQLQLEADESDEERAIIAKGNAQAEKATNEIAEVIGEPAPTVASEKPSAVTSERWADPATLTKAAKTEALSQESVVADEPIPSVTGTTPDTATAQESVRDLIAGDMDDPVVTVEYEKSAPAEVLPTNAEVFDGLADIKSSSFAELAKFPDPGHAKQSMDSSKLALDAAQAALRKFGGLGALRGLTAGGRAERESLQEQVEKAQQEYEEARAELVGSQSMALLENRLEAAVQAGETAVKERGLTDGAFEKISAAFKKLGEYNLERMTGYSPQSNVGKFLMRSVNARSAISIGLLTAAPVFAAIGPATFMGATALRRGFLGAGSLASSYDKMRSSHESKSAKFKSVQKDGWSFGRAWDSIRTFGQSEKAVMPTAEQFKAMSDDELLEKMELLEARAMLGSRDLATDPLYAVIRKEVGSRLDEVLATADSEEEKQEMLKMFMGERDFNVGLEKKHQKNVETRHRVMAVTLGGLVGAYYSLSEYFRGDEAASAKGAAAAVGEPAPRSGPKMEYIEADDHHVVVERAANGDIDGPPLVDVEHTSNNVDAAPPAEVHETASDLTEIRKGDGYVKIFARQLEADPSKYGYDAATDGDLHKWAMKAANHFAKENDLMDRGLRFDAANPGHVILNPDGTVTLQDAKDYLRAARAAAEMPVADLDQIPENPYNVYKGVQTYVDADGRPYLQHDWSRFNFGPDVPETQHAAVATAIDAHGKEIQDMTRLVDEARRTYGGEPWFNKFDLMMQKEIRGSYLDWKHDMRVAAGVDAGDLPESLPSGYDHMREARATLEATRMAGGFPEMDFGTSKLDSAINKAMDAVLGGDTPAEAVPAPKKDLLDLMVTEPAEQVADNAPVNEVRTANGLYKFLHDGNGNLTGMVTEARRGTQDLLVIDLDEDWREQVSEKAGKNWQEAQDDALDEAVGIDMHSEAYREMVKQGHGASPEAKWLAKMIATEKAAFIKRFGPIIAK